MNTAAAQLRLVDLPSLEARTPSAFSRQNGQNIQRFGMASESNVQYDAIKDHYLPRLEESGYDALQVIARESYKGSIWPYRWIRARKQGKPYFIFEKDEQEREKKRLAPLGKLKEVLEKIHE
jgi:hypothetical protein